MSDSELMITSIIEKQRCSGCGACAGICPHNAMSMAINQKGFYSPDINKDKCTNCGYCAKVCPQLGKREETSPPRNYYLGYAIDKEVRFAASSGGLATQVLIGALQERFIDGAVVVRMRQDKPLIPEPFIARTREEIMQAAGSKYCPVPLNIIMKEIIRAKTPERFGLVGLPCHICALRRAESVFSELAKKVKLRIGLFCSANKSFLGTDFLIKKNKMRKRDIINIRYRGGGWPGYLELKTKERTKKIFNWEPSYYSGIFGMFFKNKACLSCNDYLGEGADFSVGDAWGIELGDKQGVSVVVSRDELTDSLLNKFYNQGQIYLKKIAESDVSYLKAAAAFKRKLPLRISGILRFKRSELGRAFYALPFLNYLTVHPSRTFRGIFIGLLDFFVCCKFWLAKFIKWAIGKQGKK